MRWKLLKTLYQTCRTKCQRSAISEQVTHMEMYCTCALIRTVDTKITLASPCQVSTEWIGRFSLPGNKDRSHSFWCYHSTKLQHISVSNQVNEVLSFNSQLQLWTSLFCIELLLKITKAILQLNVQHRYQYDGIYFCSLDLLSLCQQVCSTYCT